MSTNDAWDWPMLMYVATVQLNRPEREFWKMTPRKLNALANNHVEANGGASKNGPKKGFIDQIM